MTEMTTLNNIYQPSFNKIIRNKHSIKLLKYILKVMVNMQL